MKYKVYVLFAIIALMFLINLGGVFAAITYPNPLDIGLKITSVSVSGSNLNVDIENKVIDPASTNSDFKNNVGVDKVRCIATYLTQDIALLADSSLDISLENQASKYLYVSDLEIPSLISYKYGDNIFNFKSATGKLKLNLNIATGTVIFNNFITTDVSQVRVYCSQGWYHQIWFGNYNKSNFTGLSNPTNREQYLMFEEPNLEASKFILTQDIQGKNIQLNSINSLSNNNVICNDDGKLDSTEECDGVIFRLNWNPELTSTTNSLTCADLINPNYAYYSKFKNYTFVSEHKDDRILCDSCEVTYNTCFSDKVVNQNNTNSNVITLVPENSSDEGYICENHVCYYSDAYVNSTASDLWLKFLVSGVTGEACYFSNSINPNWKNDASNLSSCQERLIDTNFVLGQNISGKVNVESENSLIVWVSGDSAQYLLVGTPENYDYYFFVYVNDLNYSNLLLYKINNRRIIDFYGGSLPEWIPGGIVTTSEPEPPVDESDCDKYIDTLKSDLNMVDTNIFNYDSKTLDSVYAAKRADFDTVYNRTNHTEFNNFNDNVFKVSKDGSSPLTSEETAQFWAILAQESTLGTSTSNEITSDIGLAQINYNTWCATSKRVAGFTELKLYLDFGIDTQTEYNDLCDKINIGAKFSGGGYTNLDASTVLARAIYLVRAKNIRGTNNSDFTLSSFKTYDDKDAIDAMFAVGYKYKHPSQTFYLSKKYVSTDLTNYTEDISAITQKIALYLIYKEEMCKQTNQEFINSYKTNFNSVLPREKGN